MPELLQLLHSQDLGYARIVAELWGLEHAPTETQEGIEAAAAAMLDERLLSEVVDALDAQGREAVMALARASGRIPWTAFARQFGQVREMGAGRRDREKPHHHPASPAEALFYRALLGRAFFETEGGLQEFAYMPEDLLTRLPSTEGETQPPSPPGRAAMPSEHSYITPAGDRILDEATTLLAALRTGRTAESDAVLRGFLESAGVLQTGVPESGRVKAFLAASRTDALNMLVDAWRNSASFNELRLVPGLMCDGPWSNEPRAARAFLLRQLEAVPAGNWWNLKAFLESIKQSRPDFQRPAGDYDSWFIRRAEDGQYLRGFGSWDEVEGGLIRFLITDVLHRLGLIDLGAAREAGETIAFRRAPRPRAGPAEDGRLHIGSQGRIAVGRDVPRAVRYQLARFCEWEQQGPDEYRFRITPRSMEGAARQGLRVEHLLTLLGKHGKAGIPASVTKALKRWEQAGTEARTETQVVLRVKRPEIIRELLRSRAARFLDQALGPTAISIKPGAQDKVIAALAELGLLGEDETDFVSPRAEPHSAAVKGRGDRRKLGANLTAKK